MRTEPHTQELLIVFMDISHFERAMRGKDPQTIAPHLEGFYKRVGAAVRGAGGHVCKYLGDGAICIFEEAEADGGVCAVADLKSELDGWMASLGWDCELIVQAHFGSALVGTFSDGETTFLEVVGRAVNTAATLDSTGITLSAEAFRKLSPETRKRFKKHSRPVTYIRSEDPRTRRRPRGRDL
ncbi:MAG: adenylate/guanylate cyclase domain-containing protein [Myxococcales bacterium]|nr:adenylate/guanylate cyclase domain-containing protein [Myxococcales bacterium]